jgi:hypothetical protein
MGHDITIKNISSMLFQKVQSSRASCKSVYSTEIPSNYFRESGGTGFPACADKGLNLKDIILIFFHKEHIGELRVFNVAQTCNTHLHRLESLCY